MPSTSSGFTKKKVIIALRIARATKRIQFLVDLPCMSHLPLPIQKGPVFPLGESGPPNAGDSGVEQRRIYEKMLVTELTVDDRGEY